MIKFSYNEFENKYCFCFYSAVATVAYGHVQKAVHLGMHVVESPFVFLIAAVVKPLNGEFLL